VLSAASLYAQQSISGDMMGKMMHQMYFSYVPENEFNQVFQDYLRTNYPRQNNFNPEEIKAITSNFVFSIFINDALTAKWDKYAEAKKANEPTVTTRRTTPRVLTPTEVEAYEASKRGEAAFDKKDYDKAIADYTEAIRLDPNYYNYYNRRGDAYNIKKDYDKAIADYTEAIRLDPESGSYLNRGNAYRDKGNYDKAIADYTEVIRLEPEYEKYGYISRGNAYRDKGDYDKAIADYTEAIRLDPKFVDAYINRGIAYKNKGNFTQARADVNKALQISPDYQAAKDLDAELKKKGY